MWAFLMSIVILKYMQNFNNMFIMPPDHVVMKIHKKEVMLLRDAINHYMQFQLGVNSWQAMEYESIMRKIEGYSTLLN